MSCTNPCLVQVIDTHRCNIGDRERLDKLGFKFSKDLNKAYRFAVNESRSIPLEKCGDWVSQSLIELPCGSCLSCRMDYSQDWAVRCSFEAKLWQHNYFVTLTYDDDHLCHSIKTHNPTLVKEHIELFLKSIRNYFYNRGHKGVRYLLCGEYNSDGSRSLNPHYHMILFNCPIPDLTIDFPSPEGGIIHKYNKLGLPMFYSPLFADIWDKGFITIDDANFNTESYVSKYIMKKQKGKSSSVYSEAFGVVAPFLRMSNKPGIGYSQFLQNEQKFIVDPYVILPNNNKPVVTGLPRYFKRKLFESYPELRDEFSEKAKTIEFNTRSIRKGYNTTANIQRYNKEQHLDKVSSVFSRNFE